MFKRMIFVAACIAALLISVNCFAETEKMECNPEEVFQACDANKDGKISREEWDTIDTNQDNTISNDEWDKYKYKSPETKTSPFQIKYYDVYGDGTMGKEEFLKNYQRLR